MNTSPSDEQELTLSNGLSVKLLMARVSKVCSKFCVPRKSWLNRSSITAMQKLEDSGPLQVLAYTLRSGKAPRPAKKFWKKLLSCSARYEASRFASPMRWGATAMLSNDCRGTSTRASRGRYVKYTMTVLNATEILRIPGPRTRIPYACLADFPPPPSTETRSRDIRRLLDRSTPNICLVFLTCCIPRASVTASKFHRVRGWPCTISFGRAVATDGASDDHRPESPGHARQDLSNSGEGPHKEGQGSSDVKGGSGKGWNKASKDDKRFFHRFALSSSKR